MQQNKNAALITGKIQDACVSDQSHTRSSHDTKMNRERSSKGHKVETHSEQNKTSKHTNRKVVCFSNQKYKLK